jgi:hypothetical protein
MVKFGPNPNPLVFMERVMTPAIPKEVGPISDAAAAAQAEPALRPAPVRPWALARNAEARRRWIGVGAVALTLMLALLAQWISARTAVMLGGSLLTFALSAERLNQPG